ncbi:MAG TPA: metallophosphoesterase [Pirellulales bacterium]
MLIANLLALGALLGHWTLWVGYVNRTHAIDAPRPIVKLLSTLGPVLFFGALIAVAWAGWRSGEAIQTWITRITDPGPAWFYLIPCWLIAIATVLAWTKRRFFTPLPAAVMKNDSLVIDVRRELNVELLAGGQARFLARVPGNQALELAIHERELRIDQLPAGLDRLSLAHISDLHFTGRIKIEYFREVIRRTNALGADLILITGDIVDEIELLAWIPETLGELAAPMGVYFVLGNHDEFTGQEDRIRASLTAEGLIDLGGRWQKIEIAGNDVILAGNELPWLKPAAQMSDCSPRSVERQQLRILLSHSPDQFQWARRWDFDLMLAGHTHGGQVRLPVIGPVLSPSWHGVKYAGGIFYQRPTLMHVSHGVSSEHPLRINCRPEIAKLVLRTKGKSGN